MEFSDEQKIAFDKYIQGKNIFITGPGGTGKSFLIKRIKTDAEKRGLRIQVCALTGCAAVLLGCNAKTIHSWSGIGLGNGQIQSTIRNIESNMYKRRAWKFVDILVIDEISMMSQKIFELLDSIGKTVRKNNRPFGGIQLLFLGDFYQLPPVGNKEEPETMCYCFESPLWNQTFKMENIIPLKKIFRQRDEKYSNILNQIREGRMKKSSNQFLSSLVGKKVDENELIRPTKIFPLRSSVDFINNSEMNKLNTQEVEYKLKYLRNIPQIEKTDADIKQHTPEEIEMELKNMNNSLICDETIKLKVGAQVMCIVNMDIPNASGEMICNGSQGIIKRFDEFKMPVVKFRNGYEMTMNFHTWTSEKILGVGVSQVPLILAWAITIHKSQGATMEIAEIDVGSGVFERGQTYVALSRVKSLEGLYLSSYEPTKILISKKVREFYDKLDEFAKNTTNCSEEQSEIDFEKLKYLEGYV